MPDPATDFRRKLTTIFCADVQGYTTLTEQDEVGAVTRLKQYRASMTAEIERHHGRVINTWGDGLLAEFTSPVEAVFCAVEIQRRLGEHNAAQPTLPPMQFRIGINLGDVMIDGDDIYGEGVNVTARLEALAEPGGICISGTVFDQVRKKLDIGFSFIGDREIKNIAEPVAVYRVVTDRNETRQAGSPRPRPGSAEAYRSAEDPALAAWLRMAWRFGVILGVLIVINLVTGPGYWWFIWPMLGMAAVLGLRYPTHVHPSQLRFWKRDHPEK